MVEKKILKSKEILPTNYRLSHQEISKLNAQYNLKNLDFINTQRLRYHKALEAAEQELLELKSLNTDLCNESRVLRFEAKERYKKALVYYRDTTIKNRDIIHTLKIAAGI